MKPLSVGEGVESHTLYFPIASRFPTDSGALKLLVEEMQRDLGIRFPVEVIRNADESVLKITNARTRDEALKLFERIRLLLALVTIESDFPIQVFETCREPKERPGHPIAGWVAGEKVGWVAGHGESVVRVDGGANLIYPVIVPEHKRIVELGAMRGYLQKTLKSSAIRSIFGASSAWTHDPISPAVFTALRVYVQAISHNIGALQLINFVTCLEILASIQTREGAFLSALTSARKAISDLAKDAEKDSEYQKGLHKIHELMAGYKNTSIKESLDSLIQEYRDEISSELPTDHPDRSRLEAALKELWNLRGGVAHTGRIRTSDAGQLHRSLQFARFSVKAILKAKMRDS